MSGGLCWTPGESALKRLDASFRKMFLALDKLLACFGPVCAQQGVKLDLSWVSLHLSKIWRAGASSPQSGTTAATIAAAAAAAATASAAATATTSAATVSTKARVAAAVPCATSQSPRWPPPMRYTPCRARMPCQWRCAGHSACRTRSPPCMQATATAMAPGPAARREGPAGAALGVPRRVARAAPAAVRERTTVMLSQSQLWAQAQSELAAMLYSCQLCSGVTLAGAGGGCHGVGANADPIPWVAAELASAEPESA